MRSIQLAAVSAVAILASSSAALASGVSELDVHTLASATTSPVSVTNDQSSHVSAALISNSHDNDVSDLSSANGFAKATYSTLRAYADAFDSPAAGGALELPEVQASAEASFSEFFPVGTYLAGVTYTQQISVSGSTSPQPQFGPGPDAVLNYHLLDITAREDIFSGAWFLGRPMVFNVPFVVAAGHEVQWVMDLTVSAYDGGQSKPGTVISDFQHTVTDFITTDDANAPDVIGASGHDYALPQGVPEPAAWALLLVGFAGVGVALRRRIRLASASAVAA